MSQVKRGSHSRRQLGRSRRSTVLLVDHLEARTLLSNVSWTGSGDGKSWTDPSNWSDDAVPAASDNVTINLSSNPTIQITTGNQAVQSVTSTDPISISGGSLAVTANSTLSGGLTMTGGSLTASGSSVTLSVTGTTTVSGASLTAESGATLSLPQLTSYSNPAGSSSNVLEATGTGSTLNLPALTSLGTLQNWLYIQANQGGHTLLPALDALASNSSYLQIIADGSSSKIDLSALTTLPVANTGDLTVTNQATVLDPKLTSLTNVSVTLDGTGTIATNQWATLTRDSLTITGGTYSFSGITDFDGSSAIAQAGGSLTLPAVTSYSNPSGSSSNDFQATGTGAKVNLPALTSLGTLQNWLYIEAQQGGQTLLPLLDSLASNSDYLQIIADGSSSKIDLSALTALPVANTGDLSVTNQATLLDPKLTSLTNVSVTLDGTGTIATNQWATLTRDSLTITGGTYSFSGITDFDGSSAIAQAGGSLTLPAVTSYSNPSGSSSNDFQATGTGAKVNLPALTSLGALQNWLYIEAQQGGQTLLPLLDSLASNSDYLQIIADGASSKIDLSALTTLPVANTGDLSVTNQATVLDPKLTSISGVAITLDGTGTDRHQPVGQPRPTTVSPPPAERTASPESPTSMAPVRTPRPAPA